MKVNDLMIRLSIGLNHIKFYYQALTVKGLF